MCNHCTKQLKQLTTADKSDLRSLWQELFGQPPQEALRRELMLPILAYRIQEKTHGCLQARSRNELRRMSEELRTNPKTKALPRPQIKSGTSLIREWQGQTHRVRVTDQGYEYSGKAFSSLSQIARQITGTRWSGPLFFGLRHSTERRSGS